MKVLAITSGEARLRGSYTMEKEIYLAGGCFWGVEKYLENIPGVISTEVGYANGNTENPTYEEVCYEGTGHAETVRVRYDSEQVSLPFILDMYYEVIDPFSIDRQGNDTGTQYRTGIYFTDPDDGGIITESVKGLQEKYGEKPAIEVRPLENYCRAEEYHQKYLDKNPNGYCHIKQDRFEKAKKAKDPTRRFVKKTDEELKKELSSLQYAVTQKNETEPPYQNAYCDLFAKGIYVDVTTGEPLFLSSDKFHSGCGWPSFSKPISQNLIREVRDSSHGMLRTEVRSQTGDAHLGHVFPDGPVENGGIRYCINSASLRFIPKDRMELEGYGAYKKLLEP